MTSPTDPPKVSIRDRISTRLSTDSSGRHIDAEAQHTRNVTWLFVALIVGVVVIAIAGVAFGFWESNLKPLGNVAGTEISRGQWEDRQKLEEFRVTRAEDQVRTALAAGDIDSDLANRRLTVLASERLPASTVMEELVDLLYKEKLAAEEGVSLSADEIEAAIAADGTAPEVRKLEGLVIATDAQLIGAESSPEELEELRARAEAARAELEGGASVADIVDEYAIEQVAEVDGELGYFAAGEITDPAWDEAIFAIEEEGGITPIIEGAAGEMLIGVVSRIIPATVDGGFAEAVTEEISEDAYRRNIELEALAAKLEDQITTAAVEADYAQVRVAEILVEGQTWVDPADDEGQIRASHILYQPEVTDDEGEPVAVEDVAEDDPAWEVAQAQAEQAAEQLRAVDDGDLRTWAFARRAGEDSDGPSGPRGGDLGFFGRDDMVPEFAAALFDAEDPQRGDIIGPVRSDFGWHVIMYDEYQEPLAVRLAEVEAALAEPGADFATVASQYSDADTSAEGGETGWQVKRELDELTQAALDVIEVGEISQAVDGDAGWYIYQKLEEASRPLDEEAARLLAGSAFVDWYDERRFEAEDAGEISIDDSVYADESGPGAAPVMPAGDLGG